MYKYNLKCCQSSLRTKQKGIIRSFPKLYKDDNVVNKGLRGEEQNEFSKKKPPVGIEPMNFYDLV